MRERVIGKRMRESDKGEEEGKEEGKEEKEEKERRRGGENERSRKSYL